MVLTHIFHYCFVVSFIFWVLQHILGKGKIEFVLHLHLSHCLDCFLYFWWTHLFFCNLSRFSSFLASLGALSAMKLTFLYCHHWMSYTSYSDHDYHSSARFLWQNQLFKILLPNPFARMMMIPFCSCSVLFFG